MQQILQLFLDSGNTFFLGRSLESWNLAALVFVGMFCALIVLRSWGSWRYKARKTDLKNRFKWIVFIGLLLRKISLWASLTISIYYASQALKVSSQVSGYIKAVFIIGIFLQLFIWTNAAINIFANQKLRASLEKDPNASTAINLFSMIWKFVAFSLLSLIFLDQLGFNITTLLAGLGVGGIAVALAVQNILGDLFASLTIVFDKPFRVGDYIQLGEFEGAVESVGLKTTRVRSFSGELIILSNTEILKSYLKNYSGLKMRRFKYRIQVKYGTPYELVKEIPALIEQAILSHPKARVDRVHFREYGDSALIFEVSCFIDEGDFKRACDVQQAINLAIMKVFDEKKIEFAFPSQTIYLEK